MELKVDNAEVDTMHCINTAALGVGVASYK
jgi:hypothetical protein